MYLLYLSLFLSKSSNIVADLVQNVTNTHILIYGNDFSENTCLLRENMKIPNNNNQIKIKNNIQLRLKKIKSSN